MMDKYKQDLLNVQKALEMDKCNNDVQMNDLTLKLERANTLNIQMKEELKR